jgi:hypothetical protein
LFDCRFAQPANVLYRQAQVLGVPLEVVSKEAAYQAAVPRNFYETFNGTMHQLGSLLYEIQKNALEGLWNDIRNGKIASLTMDWFYKTFTDVSPEQLESKPEKASPFNSFEKVWSRVSRLNLYDPLTLVAALPTLSPVFYEPLSVNQPEHSAVTLIGREQVRDPDALKSLLSATGKLSLLKHLPQEPLYNDQYI